MRLISTGIIWLRYILQIYPESLYFSSFECFCRGAIMFSVLRLHWGPWGIYFIHPWHSQVGTEYKLTYLYKCSLVRCTTNTWLMISLIYLTRSSTKRKNLFWNGIQRMRSERWTLTKGMGEEKGTSCPANKLNQLCQLTLAQLTVAFLPAHSWHCKHPTGARTEVTALCFVQDWRKVGRNVKFREDLRWFHVSHYVRWDTHPCTRPSPAQGSMCNTYTLYV
jgi:hypothetical protein